MDRTPEECSFFTSIEPFPQMTAPSCQSQALNNYVKSEWIESSHFTDSSSYCRKLLEYIGTEPDYCVPVNFICSDERQITIPLVLTQLALPNLVKIMKEGICCDSDNFVIFIPFPSHVVKLLRDIIVSGIVHTTANDAKKISELISVTNFKLEVFEEHSFLDTTICENEFFVEEEFSEDEHEPSDLVEELSLTNSINQFWFQECQDKVLLRNTCSKLCPFNCYIVTNSWSASKLATVKDMFQGENYQTMKTKLLNHLQVQEHMGRPTNSYFIYEHEFCSDHLSYLSGCSNSILKTVLNDFRKGVKLYHHGNSGIVRKQSSATVGFISWFVNFLSLYGQEPPNKRGIVLSYWLKGKTLYNMYTEEAPAPHISLSTFYKHLKTYFGPRRVDPSLPQVTISKYSSHSVCSVCVALNMNQKLCKSEAELNMVKSLRNQHKLDVGEARRAVEAKRQLAIDFPDDYLFLQFDGMGSYNSLIPRYLDNSKSLVGTERLPSKITGCILWSGKYQDKRKDIFYINHEQYG